MACDCSKRQSSEIFCARCGNLIVVMHKSHIDPLVSANNQARKCKNCGGTRFTKTQPSDAKEEWTKGLIRKKK